MSPLIINAHKRGIKSISQIRSDLTEKANKGALSPEEIRNGTFTVA